MDSLDQLLHDLQPGSAAELRITACEALSQAPKAAAATVVPALAAALADENPRVRQAAARAVASFQQEAAPALPGLLKLLQELEPESQAAAAFAIPQLGAVADPHMAAVISLLDKPVVGPAIIDGLERRGDKVARVVLAGALASPEPATQQAASRALAKAGFDRAWTLEFLVSCLTNARGQAVESLVKLGAEVIPLVSQALARIELRDGAEAVLKRQSNKEAVVAAVTPHLKDREFLTRYAALGVLKECGEAAQAALPELTALRDDPEGLVRSEAQRLLYIYGLFGRLFPWTWNDDPALTPDPEIDRRGVQPSDVPHLRQLVWSRQSWIRIGAYKALAHLGPAAQEATPDLILLLVAEPENPNAQLVCQALGFIGPPSPEVLAALARAAERQYVADYAMDAMAWLGAPALPTLLGLLSHPQRDIRISAIDHIGALAIEPDMCVPALAELALDPAYCKEAVRALLKFGKAAAPVLPAMFGAWTVEHYWGSLNEGLLACVGNDDPRLVAALDDPRRKVQIGAAELLADGPHRDLAIRKFEELLDPAARTGHHVAASICRIRGPAPTLVPGLIASWVVLSSTEQDALLHVTTPDDPRIIAALDSPDYRIRLNVAALLYGAKLELARAGAVLLAGLRDADPEVQRSSLWVQEFMLHGSPPECAEALFDLACCDNHNLNQFAADVLKRHGEGARHLTPRLVEKYADPQLKHRMGEILGRVNPQALRQLRLAEDAVHQGGRLGVRPVEVDAHDNVEKCTVLKSPDWPQIESLIRRLDGQRYPHVYIELNTKDWMRICSGVGGFYLCAVQFPDRGFGLKDPARETFGDEDVVPMHGIDGPGQVRRRRTVPLEMVLQGARYFCEQGELDPGLTWWNGK